MPNFDHEARLLTEGRGPIAGIDEVGRGPLAGPVLAAAVILDPDRIPVGLNDSKRMSAKAREKAFDQIMACAVVGIAEASVDEIDRLNIRRATHLAMVRAVHALGTAPAFALVDGNDAPALPCPCNTLVGGDGNSLSIAAASIVAKVTRDRMMMDLHRHHPGYGWLTNMGYGTAQHIEALTNLGITPHHRKTFAPVSEMLNPFIPHARKAYKI